MGAAQTAVEIEGRGVAAGRHRPEAILARQVHLVGVARGDPLADPFHSVEVLFFSEIERAVGQIRTQGDRCKEITYKLLSFARKTDPSVRAVVLNDMVAEVIGLTSQKTRYANVQIVTELSPDLPEIQASPTEIQQVLLNLINNAIDAVDKPGGTVTVVTRTEGDAVVLEVRDTGAGIPEANLARIFDPFFTTKPVGQGTGLGLSISYKIIEEHKGTIKVESKVDVGTTFIIQLPPRTH